MEQLRLSAETGRHKVQVANRLILVGGALATVVVSCVTLLLPGLGTAGPSPETPI